jgi:UDP-2,3-diacylglucosamine pyrophosphatase LpxH
MSAQKFRTLFISDIHLGSKGCQADMLLDFLRHVHADTIYLVGDIIDGWRLKSSWYWPQFHNDVVQKLLRKVRKGCRMVYIPGNHDEFMRDYVGSTFGGVEVEMDAIHEAADGRRYLVVHGDKYDMVVRHARWLAYLGDWAYDLAVAINALQSWVRRRLGLPYWSFSGWSKRQVKTAVNFIGSFEETVAEDAVNHGVDGVICGHIHHPTIRTIKNINYINIGDWVDSCTAIVEHFDGRFEVLSWSHVEEQKKLASSLSLPQAA